MLTDVQMPEMDGLEATVPRRGDGDSFSERVQIDAVSPRASENRIIEVCRVVAIGRVSCATAACHRSCVVRGARMKPDTTYKRELTSAVPTSADRHRRHRARSRRRRGHRRHRGRRRSRPTVQLADVPH